MVWQNELTLPPFRRGIHPVTQEIIARLPALPETGLLHLYLRHTSAALMISENADPAVQGDISRFLDYLFPENHPLYLHEEEGPDDMPAHLKSALTGISLTLPITGHRLNLGTWQGIFLCEFRNAARGRSLVATITG